jgi:hypothetical protein
MDDIATATRERPVLPDYSAPPNLPAPLAAAVRQLGDLLAGVTAQPAGEVDLLDVEGQVRDLVAAVERASVQTVLEHLDIDAPHLEINGVRHRRVGRHEASYLTGAGEVRVERSLYRAGEGRAVTTVDVLGGIVDGWVTPRAAMVACFLVGETTPGMAEEMLARVGGMTTSRSTLDRLPKIVSEDWEGHRLRYERALDAVVEIPDEAASVAISLDGVMIPMKDGDRAAKRAATRAEGRPPSGPAGYREVGCGTLTLYDADGERLATRRFGRMPESSKASLKESLKCGLDAILDRRPDLRLVKVADGAHDNWTFLSGTLPDGVEVLDYFHAVEHLSRALSAAYGESSREFHRQHERLRHKLRDDAGGVEQVIRSLRHLARKNPRSKVLRTELAYFRKNRARMQYATVAAAGLPIGSGVVEAACKTLASTRMKRSGMRWGQEGGQAILTLRSRQQSGEFDVTWSLLHQDRVGRVEMLRETA